MTSAIARRDVVYSFGVGEDISFELSLIDRFGLTIHAFDPTPRSISWVEAQQTPPEFVMHSYGVAAIDGIISFNPPENPEHISHTLLERPATHGKSISVPVRRLRTIMSGLGHERIDILKMDIEGAEYEVLQDMTTSGIRPRQLLVEFHHRFPNVGPARTLESIAEVRSMGYDLFSVSRSNEEFCFIRRDSRKGQGEDSGGR